MATGWDPNGADVVVGTSAGAFVGGALRFDKLSVNAIVQANDHPTDVTNRIREHVYQKDRLGGVGRWIRRGVIPGLTRPGVSMLLGSPARYHAGGVSSWLGEVIGDAVDTWPEKPTVVVAYELDGRRRAAFGTEQAPDVSIGEAVAASSAVPVVFSPYMILGKAYVDGGVMSGTHADLVLGASKALDLIIVIAPMAAEEERRGAWFHERIFDRVGRSALGDELQEIHQSWPSTDVLIFRPPPAVLSVMRPNPMDPDAAVPSFVRSLTSFRRELARPEVWGTLKDHLID